MKSSRRRTVANAACYAALSQRTFPNVRLALAFLGVALTLGVMGGCSSSDPEATHAGACGPGSCTLESLCTKRKCGGMDARYGADGCQRLGCTETGDCGLSERCILQFGPSMDSCEMKADGSCECLNSLDGGLFGRCIPEAEILGETCFVPTDCASLNQQVEVLELALGSTRGDLELSTRECLSRIYAKQQELSCPHTARACDGAFPCLLEELCNTEGCGGATSRLDANGCPRTLCEESADCGSNQVCFVPSLVEPTCFPTGIEGCSSDSPGSCNCFETADCSAAGLCIEPGEVPTEACVVGSDCAALDLQAESLGHSLVSAKSDLKLRLEQCADRVRQEQQALSCP
ncbi:MAG: hypothetical protein H6718_07945 [Polyangiaceae bacterium]|nr:hypothetical protein [Polyangiaceae bacterium]MCB9606669.1 hypothetical protein [Polyangiaceae bacterium]